jgi:hypothetical protein
MPFVQPTAGGHLTDWRSSCAVNATGKVDSSSSSDGVYRQYLQGNARAARDAQLRHVTTPPYFVPQGCVFTSNPKLSQYGRPS